jgi:RNA polymerase sigma-70 factor (ECF subfamily)
MVEQNFRPWLTRIVINSALMTLRRKRSHPETVEELFATHERIERLKRAICRLQPTLRNVVEIHQANDRSVKKIAIYRSPPKPQLPRKSTPLIDG